MIRLSKILLSSVSKQIIVRRTTLWIWGLMLATILIFVVQIMPFKSGYFENVTDVCNEYGAIVKKDKNFR
jgi:hypothetical protein